MPDNDVKRLEARARALMDAMSDEDARALVEAARLDADAPPLDDRRLARMRPASASAAADLQQRVRGRGRPPAAAPKLLVSLRLDQDIVERFRAGGPGWQSRINDVLREHLPDGSA